MYEVFSEAFSWDPRGFGEQGIMLISFQGTLQIFYGNMEIFENYF